MVQFGTRRYRAFAYWFLAYAIAIFGTGVSDFLHLDVKIPYAGTTLLWAVVLVAVFWIWHRSEGTLSIHSITTQRREAFYWATVFATFALGTALGDFTATSLNLGYLASGILFGVVILIPALAWWQLGLNASPPSGWPTSSPVPSGHRSPTTSASRATSAGSASATARPRWCSPRPSLSWLRTWRSLGPTSNSRLSASPPGGSAPGLRFPTSLPRADPGMGLGCEEMEELADHYGQCRPCW